MPLCRLVARVLRAGILTVEYWGHSVIPTTSLFVRILEKFWDEHRIRLHDWEQWRYSWQADCHGECLCGWLYRRQGRQKGTSRQRWKTRWNYSRTLHTCRISILHRRQAHDTYRRETPPLINISFVYIQHRAASVYNHDALYCECVVACRRKAAINLKDETTLLRVRSLRPSLILHVIDVLNCMINRDLRSFVIRFDFESYVRFEIFESSVLSIVIRKETIGGG